MTSLLAAVFGATDQGGNPLDDRLYDGAGGGGKAGVAGGRVSAESAMKVATVYRCVALLANVLATLPRGVYQRLPKGRRAAEEHPLDPIISFKPNKRQSAFEFFRLLCYSLVLRQNAYAQIVPGPGGVGELIPLHPDRIRGPEETPSGLLRYEYAKPDGTRVPLLGGIDLWHLVGLSADGLSGLSMIDVAADSIDVARAAERHAGRFLARGVKMPGILQHEGKIKSETAAAMSASFSEKYGGERGVGSVPVLWEGMKFTPIAMSHKDAEFLDSRKFSVTEIARWFGVPPHMVGDIERSTSWGTGIEEQGLHFLVYSLLPYIELIEQSARFNLIVEPEKFYVKHNVNVILRMDAKAQAEVLQIYLQNGVYSPNECRELLERNPRAGGDEYQTQLNMRIGAGDPPPPARGKKPPVDDGGNPPAQKADATEALVALATRLAEQREIPAPAPTAVEVADAVAAKAEATDQAREAAAASAARARALATVCAGQVIARETQELAAVTEKAGPSEEKRRHAVASFYGRHAAYVAQALSIPLEQAKTYCRNRLESQEGDDRALEQLVELAAAGQPGAGGGVNVTLHAHLPPVPPTPIAVSVPMVIQAAEQTLKLDGPLDVRVKEMPAPPEVETEVTVRDPGGRIRKSVTRSKG